MSFSEKLEAISKKKDELLAKRKAEIFKIIEKTSAITLEDLHIAGAIEHLKEAIANGDKEVLSKIEKLGKKVFPSRGKKKSDAKKN